ncbi:MAG TPA: ATP-binding SpoIIE family protein phosphatase [Acidobacteriaceae bacterium]|nr:ATP-binding SpoIIE family protein phosphatase [Acidobacteriaceae bacterium]
MEIIGLLNRAIPIPAGDSSQVGNARRQASSLGASLGFDEQRRAELAIIVTEAARNIAAHAGHGEIILSPWTYGASAGIDMFALDQGPGIKDVSLSMQDGFSTAGTPGNGLGAISRLGGTLQIYSSPGKGAALFVRILRDTRQSESEAPSHAMGVISLPLAGQTVSGDGWALARLPGRTLYIVADGLGHGAGAAEAAAEALRVFHQAASRTPEQILAQIHGALAKTRGAAVALAEILPEKAVLNYAGAGNIVGVISSAGKTRSLVSMNGTVGHAVGKLQQFSYPWEPNSALIMHSDGLATRWSMDLYPGLSARHPALIASVLYRDFCRRRDDATILVSRI